MRIFSTPFVFFFIDIDKYIRVVCFFRINFSEKYVRLIRGSHKNVRKKNKGRTFFECSFLGGREVVGSSPARVTCEVF